MLSVHLSVLSAFNPKSVECLSSLRQEEQINYFVDNTINILINVHDGQLAFFTIVPPYLLHPHRCWFSIEFSNYLLNIHITCRRIRWSYKKKKTDALFKQEIHIQAQFPLRYVALFWCLRAIFRPFCLTANSCNRVKCNRPEGNMTKMSLQAT